MRIPTDSEIAEEAGLDNDFFAAKARLEQQFRDADAAVEKLKPIVTETDGAPWRLEPTAAEVLAEAKNFALTLEDARESLRRKFAADARRLAAFSPNASAEISAALSEAAATRERAESLLAEHEAALSAVTSGIFAVGKIRQKIAVVKALALDADGERQLAKTALDFWVDQKTTSATTQNVSGFRALAEDLVWRRALNAHISEFVAPLKNQAAALIEKIRAEASAAGMDLKKVFDLLASERGQRGGDQLLHDPSFYAGLI